MDYSIEKVIVIAREAGKKILEVYGQNFESDIDFKADNSPLTLADKASHQIINRELLKSYPHIPVLSEEGRNIEYQERKNWKKFWLVDPLDGTKEFIKRNGEFTVNIAFMEHGYPVFGVIYTPVTDTVYYGEKASKSAYKIEGSLPGKRIEVNKREADRIAVRSRSHASEEEETLLKGYGVTDSISVGSSLKFCMVAEGKADIYYRHGPTMEWDTAAGQAVVEAAGGEVLRIDDKKRFVYNKENLLNPGFLVLGF